VLLSEFMRVPDGFAPRKSKRTIKVVPYLLDQALTVAYIIAVVWTFWSFGRESFMSLSIYAVLLLSTAVMINVTRWVAEKAGNVIDDHILTGEPWNRPLSKKGVMRKWRDQAWQLFIHISMTLLELYVLSDERWWSEPATTWFPYPMVAKPSLHLLYLAQLAIWVYTGFSHRFLEARRHDYVVMFIHHISTILLLALSHSAGYQRIGILVLFVHDISDIPVDLLKMTNYLKIEGPKSFYIVEIVFVSNLLSWIYWRLYRFPSHVMYSAYYDSLGVMGCPYDVFPLWIPTNGMLFVLLCLHVWWFFLFLRLGYYVVIGDPHGGGEKEYEGHSSGSDVELPGDHRLPPPTPIPAVANDTTTDKAPASPTDARPRPRRRGSPSQDRSNKHR